MFRVHIIFLPKQPHNSVINFHTMEIMTDNDCQQLQMFSLMERDASLGDLILILFLKQIFLIPCMAVEGQFILYLVRQKGLLHSAR